MSNTRDVQVEISHSTHFADGEERYYIVTFDLYFFGIDQGPLEVNVAIPDEGQSSEQFHHDAREVLSGKLEGLRKALLDN